LFVFAWWVRVDFARHVRSLPTQDFLVMDAARYDEWAHEIAAGAWVPRDAFAQAPLYPYLLAGIYASGGSRDTVRSLQAFAGAATVLLLALAARHLHPWAGWAAGGLAAISGPLIYQGPLLLKTSFGLLALGGFLCLMLPVALAPGASSGHRWRLAAAGASLGIAALLQEHLILLIACVAAWLTWRSSRARRCLALVEAGAFALGAVAALAPVVTLNWVASGRLVASSAQGGVNFYIGNAKGATGTYVPLSFGSHDPQRQAADARRLAAHLASVELGRTVPPEELSAPEVSTWLWRGAVRQIAADPERWVRLMGRKLQLFWNAYEIPDAEGYRVLREHGGAVAQAWIGFGWIAPLGLLGLILGLRSRPTPEARAAGWFLVGMVGVVCVSVVLFFVFGRYRLFVVPVLVVAAGSAVAELALAVRDRAKARVAGWLVSLPVLALVVGWPVVTPEEQAQHDGAIYYNLGVAASQAVQAALSAHATDPDEPSHLVRAGARAQQALEYLGKQLAADPRHVVARAERVVALHRLGRVQAAAGEWQEATSSQREAALAVRGLEAEIASGALPAAEAEGLGPRLGELRRWIDEALAVALGNRGLAELGRGDLTAAEASLREAIALRPEEPRLLGSLGAVLLAKAGRQLEHGGDAVATHAEAALVFRAARESLEAARDPALEAFLEQGQAQAEAGSPRAAELPITDGR
jgi:hypothetical protein